MKNQKNKGKFFLLVASLFLFFYFIQFTSAEVVEIGPFKQNRIIQLVQVCDNCTFVNVTVVQLPLDAGRISINATMAKNGQNYNYSFAQTSTLGTYMYTTCGNPDGVLTCQTVNFLVTPSGNKDVLGLFIIVISIIYAIALFGFFGRNVWISLLGGLGLITLGLFTLNNGIDIFRNSITEVFSWTTIGLGAFVAIFTSLELIDGNM